MTQCSADVRSGGYVPAAAQVWRELSSALRQSRVRAGAWRGRRLHRVGPQAAPGLIGGPADVPVSDCSPGARTSIDFAVEMPAVAATLAACWEIVDQQGRPCYAKPVLLRVVLVGH